MAATQFSIRSVIGYSDLGITAIVVAHWRSGTQTIEDGQLTRLSEITVAAGQYSASSEV